MTNTRKTIQAKNYPLIRFFVVTYAISWALWIPMALTSQGVISIQIPSFLGIVIGGFSPSFTAIVLTLVEEGEEGIQALFARLLRWRVAVSWYLFVLLAPAMLILGSIFLQTLPTGTVFELPKISNWPGVFALFVLTLLIGGPLGEEIGWRGYALPKSLANWNSLLASIIIGILWGLWHLPLFWIQDSLQSDIPLAWFLISILAESILYTWIHIRTKGSLLLVILFHAAINTWAKILLLPQLVDTLNPLLLTFALEITLAIIVIVLARRKFFSSEAR